MGRMKMHKTGVHDPKALQIINFRSDESNYTNDPHDDALVISLSIANCLTKRILVDNGSSANVLFLNAYREMGLKEADITRRCISLVGFSGESKTTIGETVLPIYAEGVNLYTKFVILDSPSVYNVILGRPWIHKMEAVPSTYHQIIKFPTKWGVKEIYGQQHVSRQCYQTTLKTPVCSKEL